LLVRAGAAATRVGPETLEVTDRGTAWVGAVASAGGIELHELSSATKSLEEVFLQLTAQAREPRR
jgi:ABC-2 type transport system ATP-binding protein